MTDLLVAAAGGHLAELLRLVPRLGIHQRRLWITDRGVQAASLRGDADVIYAHHPATRNLQNALRNYRLARRVFDQHHIDRVISTGAGVAVPFMIRARQLGIECHYLDSATFVAGPSLSGRILQRVGGIHLYRQSGVWGTPRWRQGPSVFDGFAVTSAARKPVRRVLVSLGTHQFPFTSLVQRIGLLADEDPPIVIRWQLGSTQAPHGMMGNVTAFLPPADLDAAVAAADVVVGHAGVGLALTTLAAGKVPVVVPRRSSRGEHTDDHQGQLAAELARRGLAVPAEVGELSREHLDRAAEFTVGYREPAAFPLTC